MTTGAPAWKSDATEVSIKNASAAKPCMATTMAKHNVHRRASVRQSEK